MNGKDLGMDVIFEDEDIIALDKKSGVIVQTSFDNPNSIAFHYLFLQDQRDDHRSYCHVHRLDKETTGVLIIGKNRETIQKLNKLFRERKVKKEYECLVIGKVEKGSVIKLNLIRNPDKSAKEKVLVNKKGKETVTHYKPVEYSTIDGIKVSKLHVEIETGFMHQIRVHLNHIGHPIVGDKLYGLNILGNKFDRHQLTSAKISFEYKEKKYKITR